MPIPPVSWGFPHLLETEFSALLRRTEAIFIGRPYPVRLREMDSLAGAFSYRVCVKLTGPGGRH